MVNGRCVAWQRDGRGSVQCVEVEKTSRSTGLASALRLRPENICSVETLLFLIRNGSLRDRIAAIEHFTVSLRFTIMLTDRNRSACPTNFDPRRLIREQPLAGMFQREANFNGSL
jgi:hypothetical protein